jgi:hypothetical protein
VDERQEPQIPAQWVLGADAPQDRRDVMPDRPLWMPASRRAPPQPGQQLGIRDDGAFERALAPKPRDEGIDRCEGGWRHIAKRAGHPLASP